MKAALPLRQDYYRPTRARELRERADRRDELFWFLGGMDLTVLVLSAVLALLDLVTAQQLSDVLILSSLLFGAAVLLAFPILGLYARSMMDREDARAFEAEHRVRYGADEESAEIARRS